MSKELKKFGINPKDFKYESSDKDSTTLRHNKGHSLRIAHNVVSPNMRKALQEMAKSAMTDSQKQEAEDSDQYGKVIRKAQGGVAENDPEKAKAVAETVRGKSEPQSSPPQRHAVHARPSYSSSFGDEAWPSPSQTSVGKAAAQNKARGGEVEKMASGGVPNTENADFQPGMVLDIPEQPPDVSGSLPKETPSSSQVPVTNIVGKPIGSEIIEPEKPIVGPAVEQGIADAKNILLAPAGTMPTPQVKPVDIAATKADALVDQLEAQKTDAQAVANAAHEQAAAQAQPVQVDKFSPEALAQKGYAAETQAPNMAAKAIANEGAAKAEVLEHDVSQRAEIQKKFDEHMQVLDKERQAFINDARNNLIDPNQYWTGVKNPVTGKMESGHSKIMAAIGMIISGFGAGLSGGPNMAMQLIQHGINQNIEAQKANLGMRNNLLSANLAQYKNVRDAVDMTRIMLADATKMELEKAAMNAAGPKAKAEAMAKIGEINRMYQPIFMGLQMRRVMQDMGGGGNQAAGTTGRMLGMLDATNPEMAKQYRERYYQPYDLPGGTSIANRPIEKADRDALLSADNFDSAAKTLHDIINKNRGNLKVLLDPTNPTSALAKQQALIVQQLVREGFLGGVYKEGEQPLLDKAIKGDPLSLIGYFKELPKLEQLIRTNQMMKQRRLDAYGLKAPMQATPMQQRSAAAHPLEGKTASDAKGNKIVMKNGQWVSVGR